MSSPLLRNDSRAYLRLRPQEGQQVGIELLLVREGQAVGRPRIDLQGRVLDELGGEQGRVSDRHDLVVVSVDDQGRNVERLEVFRLVCLGEGFDAVEGAFEADGHRPQPEHVPSALRHLGTRSVGPEEGGAEILVELRTICTQTGAELIEHLNGEAAWIGRRLASGDREGTIRLWERQQTGPARCVQTLEGHTNRVRGLAFAPGGSRLASASYDGTIKLWEVGEVPGHRLRQTLVGHSEGVQTLAWSPDGGTLASGGLDHTIRLWEVEQRSSRAVLQGHSAIVYGLAFTPDSRHLLSGSDDGTLRLWEAESGQCVRVMQGYSPRPRLESRLHPTRQRRLG